MQTVMVPFGLDGWEARKRIFDDLIASRPQPPYIYNNVLILVPSSRLKRLTGRLFLDLVEGRTGSKALVQPQIQTLHQFLQNQFSRLQGPRLIDENSRLILLEGLVKELLAGSRLFDQSPDLLAPSLSSVLAKTIEQLSAADVGPEDLGLKIKGSEFSCKPQVMLLLDVYARYETALREAHLTDPAGMRSWIDQHFDPAWLSPYARVVIDGVHAMDGLERSILKKIAGSGNCTVIVEAPSPDVLLHAGEQHPLGMIRDFFSSLGVTPDRQAAPAGPDVLYLASSLFSERTFSEIAREAPEPSGFSKKIDVLSAVNIREEVSLIARHVKKSLRRGLPADTVLVAFPALDEYGALVEEIFGDYGIPYNRALGRQLSTSAVATAVIALLRACQEEYSAPSLLRVFSSPFLKFSERPAVVPALDRLLRKERIVGGKQKLLSAAASAGSENGPGLLTEPLRDLFSALEPFSRQDAAPLSLWMDRLSGLIAWSGLGERVSHIKGALNINLQAYKKLGEALLSLAEAGRTFPDYRYTFNEWLFLLKKTFMHARFQVPPEDEGGVQVLGLEESISHAWKEIYLGGLVEGKFPQRLPQNIFLPEQTLEALGVRTRERARINAAYHFYRLLLSADRVMLSYPENEGDRPVVPSPFLEELTPLRRAGLLNRGIEKTSGIQFSLKIEESCSLAELSKAVSLAGSSFHALSQPEWPEEVSRVLPGWRSALSAFSAQHEPPARAAQPPAPPARRVFSVTELDAYLNCPYDYYVTRVLGIEPLEEPTEDLTPMDRGSKVHGILRNFYLSWNKPVEIKNRDEARALLRTLADASFDREPDTFRNRREKERFLAVMAERFLAAEIGFWKQDFRPVALERKIQGYPLVLSKGQEVELSGTIDRIDADSSGNFIIVDYKTGRYPAPRMNTEQDIFQLPIYALMALSQRAAGGVPALKKPIGLAYYDLAGKTGAGARDVVLFNRDARNDHTSSKPRASSKTGDEFETILNRSLDKARQAVEDILAGRFPVAPRDENKCRYCPNEMMCERE
jgi:ATP-dependent helicase/DNAse subunit B